MSTHRSPRAALRSLIHRSDAASTPTDSRSTQLGQVLPIFAVMAVTILGGAALLTDVAWWWTNEQRMQRAADAAALAGAVYLPADQPAAFSAAFDAASKNGYTSGVGGVTITPRRDPANPRKLIVDVDGPVQTSFARVFCWSGGPCLQTVDVGVTGAAEFVLPVPMGSPENYYGVFGMVRGATSSAMVTTNHQDPGWSCTSGSGDQDTWGASGGCGARTPNESVSGSWTATSGGLNSAVTSNNDVYARTDTNGNGDDHVWRIASDGLLTGIPNPASGETLAIVGIQVRLQDAFISSSCSGSGRSASIGVELSWGGGSGGTWSTEVRTSGSLPTSTTSGDYVLGSATSTADWGGHAWTRDELSTSSFRIRLIGREDCTNDIRFNVDRVDVRIKWLYSYASTSLQTTTRPDTLLEGPGTPCTTSKEDCFEADGAPLNPRGFWGTLNTQGAENVNGDAYQAGYDTRTSATSPACPQNTRACYDGSTYYNYAIEMPPGATNGMVYVYDPQFCAVNVNRGTGDRWFSGSTAVSTFYTLYDTGSSLYDLAEDTELAFSGDRFRTMDWDDSTMGGSGGDECMYRADSLYDDGRDWHNRWYLLNPDDAMAGGTDGKIYRIHTSSTDPSNATQQLGTNGENSFAMYVSADVPSGGPSPRIYGLGAMQAFTPLSSSSSIDSEWADDVISEFYLAQIDAAHAGKTIEIRLWDPGDTQALRAELQILQPTSAGWTETDFSYTATQGTTNSGRADCNSLSGNGTSSVLTNNGGGSGGGIFNGCWLMMRTQIPATYAGDQDGWWKIRYRMDGDDTSNDVTTWQVQLIGNPVHLVPE